MKKILMLAVFLAGCDNASDMYACKRMCEPMRVKQFAPATDNMGCKVPPSCICDDGRTVEK
jgi:hypothetical protein